jgi:hypothetical protein
MKYTAILLMACLLPGQQKRPATTDLKRLLTEQGFSGSLTSEARFTEIGDLACNTRKLRLIYYEWEESNPPGNAIHAQYRILFIGDKSKYIGSYIVEDRPTTILSDALVFGYEGKLGNKIQCNAQGLPKTVLLNGESSNLFK